MSDKSISQKVEEREVEADVFVSDLYCIEDDAKMRHTGLMFPTHPPKHEYQCPVCKRKQITTIAYPYVTYKEKLKGNDRINLGR